MKSIRYEAEVRAGEGDEARVVARGGMTVVWARKPHGSRAWIGEPLPDALASTIEEAP